MLIESYRKRWVEKCYGSYTFYFNLNYLTERICTQRANWERNGDYNVRIEDAGDISEFLEGVMMHPTASMWYVDIVRDICQSKNIKFDGQSEIYTLK